MSASARTPPATASPPGLLPHDAAALDQHGPPSSALSRYAIQAELGRGTMGVVYRAVDLVLNRTVALKLVKLAFPLPEEEQRLVEQRFLREARLAACLTHPNIVVVHDVGWDAETRTPFMALEYIEGRTLGNVLASAPTMEWRAALRLVSRLADALHHAHGHGIVHRDIKPANIMILPSGDAKIMDFSIAKASAAEANATSECWGTPSYMSPEQACGEPLDGRSDLFSLGSVLYQLLTGQRPFTGDNVPQIMTRVVRHEPLLPSRIDPALPRDLDLVITRALAKDPKQRYPDGQAFAEDLQDVLHSRPLRGRDGLKTLPALESTAGIRPADGPAAAPLGMRPQASSRRLGPVPLMAVGAGLAVIALLGYGYTTIVRTPAPSRAPVATALGPPATSSPSLSLPPAPEPSAGPKARSRSNPVSPEPEAPALALMPAAVPARLALSVHHGVKQGHLRLWIDDRLMLETELVSSEIRKILVFKQRSGSLAEVFDVAPGDRLVRVEVEEDGRRRSAGLSGLFESSKTRQLEVNLGGNVDLRWKS